GLPAKGVLQVAKFLGKVVGSFLQVVAVSMNWCEVNSMDSLWLSQQEQRQGVGTLGQSPRVSAVV
ncbi:hypothetical protein, partial [Pseudomonas migulae]|uniref:hypothetical protein n=1 Tax=Pseudomonas migulae TaxID=78543 RepID=UPI001C3FD7D5